MSNTLRKSERLDKKKVIEKMFAGGLTLVFGFPCVWCICRWRSWRHPFPILVSVSKRRFKRAVKAQPRETPDT